MILFGNLNPLESENFLNDHLTTVGNGVYLYNRNNTISRLFSREKGSLSIIEITSLDKRYVYNKFSTISYFYSRYGNESFVRIYLDSYQRTI